ncbi:MAG TPA: fused MFS/spermidine synthase [Chthonomonadaceae bacterium]|nr:fused MFS/spermidine synthase [Chthonomonadaceae bacterium]
MRLYAVTIFVSAFLLFQVQPIIAKSILPWFGGTSAVWTTCLLFFQTVLLLGYLYAHGLAEYLADRRQRRLHTALLVVSLAALPILPRESWKPTGTEEPTLRVLLLLLVTVGLPYFLLSTTGPLLQAWYTRGGMHGGRPRPFPYRLYAISNAGSMLALITYPILVEPRLTLHQQAWTWSAGYALFVLLCGLLALRTQPRAVSLPETDGERAEPTAPPEPAVKPTWQMALFWVALSACSSVLLLAVTTHLTQNVAAIPFLWVLPLSLYLLSFIVCFGSRTWEWKKPFLALPPLALGAMGYAVVNTFQNLDVEFLVPLFAAGLFVCCLLCHGELARLKPHPRYLTAYYLMISIGGALGGLLVGVAAPHLFSDYYELPLALAACTLLALFVLYYDPTTRGWDLNWLALCALTALFLLYLGKSVEGVHETYRRIARNFYGVLRISDPDDPQSEDAVRTLTHGTIRHGSQFLAPQRRREPTTYYGRDSGIGLAIRIAQAHPQDRIGIIGLGTGTIAAYSRPGDVYRFYDINPLVVQIARTEFSYLKDSPAQIEIALGDARLSLEREPPQRFDVLAVDAFSSDAIPVHLLTKEALALYFRHMKPDGIVAVHVSNRYLELEPVVAQAALALGKQARLVESGDDDDNEIAAASWVLVANRPEIFDSPVLKDKTSPIKIRPDLRTWTDDYSNLYQILK